MHPQSPCLYELAERWSSASAAERANAQLYLTELADALEVERPRPAGSGFEFELPVKVVGRDGRETTTFVDLFRAGHFVLEAKPLRGRRHRQPRGSSGSPPRGTRAPGAPPPFRPSPVVGEVRPNGRYETVTEPL